MGRPARRRFSESVLVLKRVIMSPQVQGIQTSSSDRKPFDKGGRWDGVTGGGSVCEAADTVVEGNISVAD